AGLARLSVADLVGQDNVVARDVERLARAVEGAGENRAQELMPGAAGAVDDEHGVVHHSGCVLAGRAQGRIVQVQARQRFAVVELEVADGVVALGRGPNHGGPAAAALGGGAAGADERCGNEQGKRNIRGSHARKCSSSAMSLFDALMPPPPADGGAPLADRMRPRTLEEIAGQQHLLAPGKPLRRAIERDALASILLWGPPGVGKTTLARVIAA